MTEQNFYRMLDIAEAFNDVSEGYYPTVEELKAHDVENNIDKFLVILAYFASDPFTKQDIEGKHDEEYLKTVKYSKKLLYNYSLKTE